MVDKQITYSLFVAFSFTGSVGGADDIIGA